MPLPTPASEPVQITVVESEACHFCADAHQALATFATRFPVSVRTVDVRSEVGRALVARHRAPMNPLVLLDGAFFSSGRLPRRKLEKLLTGRYRPATVKVRSASDAEPGPAAEDACHG
jgi:alkyl hydroperoxide reductase subunit AhpF